MRRGRGPWLLVWIVEGLGGTCAEPNDEPMPGSAHWPLALESMLRLLRGPPSCQRCAETHKCPLQRRGHPSCYTRAPSRLLRSAPASYKSPPEGGRTDDARGTQSSYDKVILTCASTSNFLPSLKPPYRIKFATCTPPTVVTLAGA